MKKLLIFTLFINFVFAYFVTNTCSLAAVQTQGQVVSTEQTQETTTISSTPSTNTIINSVKESDDSTVAFGLSEAINVILCAIGVVIIFLGIAILIKIKR